MTGTQRVFIVWGGVTLLLIGGIVLLVVGLGRRRDEHERRMKDMLGLLHNQPSPGERSEERRIFERRLIKAVTVMERVPGDPAAGREGLKAFPSLRSLFEDDGEYRRFLNGLQLHVLRHPEDIDAAVLLAFHFHREGERVLACRLAERILLMDGENLPARMLLEGGVRAEGIVCLVIRRITAPGL